MARLFLALLLLLPFVTPVRAADSGVETQLHYLEKDLDRLREEMKTLPEARRLDRLEAEIAGLRTEIKAAEKSAEEAVKEKLDKRLDAQDKRIEDLSTSLTMQANQISWHSLSFNAVSTFITLVLVCMTIWTAISVPRQARDAAQIKAEELNKEAITTAEIRAAEGAEKTAASWIKDNAEPRLAELEIRAKRQHAETDGWIKNNAEPRLKELEEKATNQHNEYKKKMDGIISSIKIQDEMRDSKKGALFYYGSTLNKNNIDPEIKNTIEYIQSLPESERTPTQWRALIQKLLEQNSFQAAIEASDRWLAQSHRSRAEGAYSLRTKQFALGRAGMYSEAIATAEEIKRRYGDSRSQRIRNHIAISLNNKGSYLMRLTPPQFEAAITTFNEVINLYGSNIAPNLKIQVARALIRKGVALSQVSPPQAETEMATYDEVVSRFGEENHLTLIKEVATALHYKGQTLSELNRTMEARITYEDYLNRFKYSSEPVIQAITMEVRDALAKLPPAEPPTPADP